VSSRSFSSKITSSMRCPGLSSRPYLILPSNRLFHRQRAGQVEHGTCVSEVTGTPSSIVIFTRIERRAVHLYDAAPGPVALATAGHVDPLDRIRPDGQTMQHRS
jgi:hypothetical protein